MSDPTQKLIYLEIPRRSILAFDFRKFVDYVVNTSPVYSTRALVRSGYKVLAAVDAAADGIVVLPRDVAELFARAADDAEIPPLFVVPTNGNGQVLPGHEPTPLGKSAWDPYFEAVEGMTEKRPERDATCDVDAE